MTLTKKQKKELWEDFEQKTQSGKLVYISPKESRLYRKQFWLQQNKKCAILRDEIKFEDSTLDHEHKLEGDKLGDNGKGLVRAVLHKEINALEGRIYNSWGRTSLKNKYRLQDVLRALAQYYDSIEQGTLPIEQKYIYPSERPSKVQETLTKNDRKKIYKYYFKVYPNRTKLPKLPNLLRGGKNPALSDTLKKVLQDIDDYIKGKR